MLLYLDDSYLAPFLGFNLWGSFALGPSFLSCGMGNADQESAYKTSPRLPAHREYANLAVKQPNATRRSAFRPNAQLFGSAAIVLHYSIFSRLIISLFSRIFLVPDFAYFDYFGWVAPIDLVKECYKRVFDFYGPLARSSEKWGNSLRISRYLSGFTVVTAEWE